MSSARNLLAYGTRVVRTAAFLNTTRDPILTMLSIGVEKLYKLTLGLASLDTRQSWPTKAEMKGFGHNLADMHSSVMTELSRRTAVSTLYVRGLLAEVEADAVVIPLINTLGRYGQSGRFTISTGLETHLSRGKVPASTGSEGGRRAPRSAYSSGIHSRHGGSLEKRTVGPSAHVDQQTHRRHCRASVDDDCCLRTKPCAW